MVVIFAEMETVLCFSCFLFRCVDVFEFETAIPKPDESKGVADVAPTISILQKTHDVDVYVYQL